MAVERNPEGERKKSAGWPSGPSCGQGSCTGNRLRLGRRLLPAVRVSDVAETLYPSLLLSTLFYFSLPYRRLLRAVHWCQTGYRRPLPGTLYSLPINRSQFLGPARGFQRKEQRRPRSRQLRRSPGHFCGLVVGTRAADLQLPLRAVELS